MSLIDINLKGIYQKVGYRSIILAKKKQSLYVFQSGQVFFVQKMSASKRCETGLL